MARRSNIKPFKLGAAHAARLCSENALLDGAHTSCSRCTCLYSLASSRGTHACANSIICSLTIAPNIHGHEGRSSYLAQQEM